jgi:isopenicillin-N epimerase
MPDDVPPTHREAEQERVYGAVLRPLWGLEDGIRQLNHGSYGGTPKEVLADQDRWRARMEADPPRFFMQELPGLVRAAAAELARFVGTRPERLAFVENATAGVNAVLRSLRFGPGDELLTTDHVYPGIRNTMRYLAERAGAGYVEVATAAPRVDTDGLLAAIRSGFSARTRILVVDHVASASATRFPLAEIGALCGERGVALLVDGAHAAGMVELDIDAIGTDWYVGNCHKWLCAPKGAGFLVAREGAQDGIHPTVISNRHGSGFPAEFDYVGTRDATAWLSVPAAIAFHERLGGPALRQRNRALAREVAELATREIGGELAASPELFEAMVALRLPAEAGTTREQAARLQARLSREHKIEVAVTVLAGVLHLRLCAFAYNEIGEYRGVGEIVRSLLGGEKSGAG